MTNPNDPAFIPQQFDERERALGHTHPAPVSSGLTKREHIAAIIAAGMWANSHIAEAFGQAQRAILLPSAIASDAVKSADALIAALAAPSEEKGAVE